MVSMRYRDKAVPDFEQLVKLLPPSAVASPLRSAAPLVDFWRTPKSRLAQLGAIIGGWRRAIALTCEAAPLSPSAYRGPVSLPFEAGQHECVAVKIGDDRGIESLKVVEVA
jgi:hypothetical protein